MCLNSILTPRGGTLNTLSRCRIVALSRRLEHCRTAQHWYYCEVGTHVSVLLVVLAEEVLPPGLEAGLHVGEGEPAGREGEGTLGACRDQKE